MAGEAGLFSSDPPLCFLPEAVEKLPLAIKCTNIRQPWRSNEKETAGPPPQNRIHVVSVVTVEVGYSIVAAIDAIGGFYEAFLFPKVRNQPERIFLISVSFRSSTSKKPLLIYLLDLLNLSRV